VLLIWDVRGRRRLSVKQVDYYSTGR